MTTVPVTIWDDILGQVRLNHPQLVRGWFSSLQLTRIDQGVVYLCTSNRAQSDYLQQHCRLAFSEAAQAATGRLVTVAFQANGSDDAHIGTPGLPFADDSEQLVLNPDYTFDHFVTGPCNRLAHAAALAVADDPGRAYNPFFAYGPVGLGKTHLLQAICHVIHECRPETTCHYISCETFINHFIQAVE